MVTDLWLDKGEGPTTQLSLWFGIKSGMVSTYFAPIGCFLSFITC